MLPNGGYYLNKQLELLIETQKLDSVMIKESDHLSSAPSRLSAMEKPLKDAQSILLKENDKYESVKKKKKDKERQLEDINEKIKKSKARASEIKTNKEYQAYLKEMESIDKERFGIEDEILLLMEEIEIVEADMRSAKTEVDEQSKKTESLKKELKEDARLKEKDLDALKAKRSELVSPIEPDIYNLYMSLIESMRGLAVASATNEVCSGCNMNIPPQMFVAIKKNEDILQCPQCKRILYYPEKTS